MGNAGIQRTGFFREHTRDAGIQNNKNNHIFCKFTMLFDKLTGLFDK